MNDLDDFISTLNQLNTHRKENKLQSYEPYKFQLKFHNAIGEGTDKPAIQKSLVCANKIGKSLCASNEVAMHLTGLYPDWYQGMKFDTGIEAVCGTHTIEQTRDILQAMLFGPPGLDEELGTGSVPKDLIINAQKRPGYGTAFDFVDVKHVPSGTRSRIFFRAYEIGERKHMGRPMDLTWEDEEPPFDIHMQMVRGGFAKDKSLKLLTFTPEFGATDMAMKIVTEVGRGQAVIRAGWKDAPHMVKNWDEKIAEVPEWQRPFRVHGEISIGEGAVFPIANERIECDPFQIPPHWPRIAAIDIGWAHPFAVAWLALDRDSGITYGYRVYREVQKLFAQQAAIIKGTDPWIPVMWPHDAAKHDAHSGRTYRDIMASEPHNVRMHLKPFSNPPNPGMPEGSGGQGVEIGLEQMLNAFENGTLKIFKTCREFFEEKSLYHRKLDAQGKWILVKKMDDVISAIRYAYMMQRFAITKPGPKRQRRQFTAVRGW